jgi:hypothetical protein
MDTSFDVRIWTTEVYKGSRTTTYTVRWKVGQRARKETFKTAALADAFRSALVTAARRRGGVRHRDRPAHVDGAGPAEGLVAGLRHRVRRHEMATPRAKLATEHRARIDNRDSRAAHLRAWTTDNNGTQNGAGDVDLQQPSFRYRGSRPRAWRSPCAGSHGTCRTSAI